jgi:hypothetical protein
MVRPTGMPLAVLALALACGSRPKNEAPVPVGPVVPAGPPPAVAAGSAGRAVLVGEMCPTAAVGRPAVRPLFVRGETWSDRQEALVGPVERRGARQFSVLGWDGRRAGLFSVAGAARTDDGIAAIGAYAGHSPCERRRGAEKGARDPDCAAALRDCGLAVAVLEPSGGFHARPAEEDPDPVAFEAGGACVAGGILLVDIDGDKKLEAYPAAGFADRAGAASNEVAAVAAGSAACTPRFAVRGAIAAGVDLLAVVDLDADGRNEILAQFQSGGHRSWALYSATSTVGRLERVGVGSPWRSR